MAITRISEKDFTANNSFSGVYDIAYIPGFGDLSVVDDPGTKPILCRSVGEFKRYFGNSPQELLDDDEKETINFGSRTMKFSGKDPSYVMALQLLQAGMPVYYERVNGDENDEISAQFMYSKLISVTTASGADTVTSILTKLKDKGSYSIKYLTTGGYPSFEYEVTTGSGSSAKTYYLTSILSDVAGAETSTDEPGAETGRGDCIALIDHINDPTRALTGTGSVDAVLNGNDFSSMVSLGSFCAMFTPWNNYPVSGVDGVSAFDLPASYAYLKAVAEYTRFGKNNWLSIANVARGKVVLNSQLTDEPLTVSVANYYQKDADHGSGVSHNAITYVNPYGYCIWGNRTLKVATENEGVTATGFLNIRSVLCDIKKVVYEASQENMFEPNSDSLWLNFMTKVEDVLQKARTASAIESYKIFKDENRSTKTKFYAIVQVVPMYSVETFDITISVTDSDISVTE